MAGKKQMGRERAGRVIPAHTSNDAAPEAVRQQTEIVAACARAAAGSLPRHGVLVVKRGVEFLSAKPDVNVPFGIIHFRQERKLGMSLWRPDGP